MTEKLPESDEIELITMFASLSFPKQKEETKSFCCQDSELNDVNSKFKSPPEVNRKHSEDARMPKTENTPKFFAVSLPQGTPKQSSDPLVYDKIVDALSALKRYKGARFKEFRIKQDAVLFASQPLDLVCPSRTPSVSVANAAVTEQSISEQRPQIKAATSQEIVKLRKAIEKGDMNYFLEVVWANPTYLINSGEAPTIMHEGYRYNGLHAAARNGQSEMCKVILETIQNPKFYEKLYNDTNLKTQTDRMKRLADLYLNTPDKGLCETPLHFAAKFGHVDVVKILLSNPLCDKERKNKYGQTAKEIICERDKSPSEEKRNEIYNAFDEQLFVCIPVFRDENNAIQPVIGKPCSPEFIKESSSKILLQPDVRNPFVSVKAYAGPMSPDLAKKFYKLWKSPASPSVKNELKDPISQHTLNEIRLSDIDKGLERIGRKLAQDLKINWTEYWPALDIWVNLASMEGLLELEKHLKMCYEEVEKHKSEKKATKDLDKIKDDVRISCKSVNKTSDQKKMLETFIYIVRKLTENFLDCMISLLFHASPKKDVCSIFESLISILKELIHLNFSSESKLYFFHCILGLLFHLNVKKQLEDISVQEFVYSYLKTLLFPSSGINAFACDREEPDAVEWQHLYCLLRYFYYHSCPCIDYVDCCTCDWKQNTTEDCCSASVCYDIIVKCIERYKDRGYESLIDVFNEIAEELDETCIETDDFFTPPHSPSFFSMSECEEDNDVFVEGSELSKNDVDVFRAIEDIEVSCVTFPHVYKWKSMMSRKLKILNEQQKELQVATIATPTSAIRQISLDIFSARKGHSARKTLF